MKIVEVEIDALDLRYAKLRARRPAVEKRLMASLEEAGQHSPVIVVAGEEPGRWVLIEGRKRVRALKRLKAEAVKAVVWELAPPEALIAAYQLQDGSGWNALEEGWLVWELVRGDGLSLAEVGRRLERSKAWMSGRLGLVEGLPERVLEGVLSGKIGAYVATAIFCRLRAQTLLTARSWPKRSWNTSFAVVRWKRCASITRRREPRREAGWWRSRRDFLQLLRKQTREPWTQSSVKRRTAA